MKSFSLLGLVILPNESLSEVYNGLWGYSPILSTCALTCVFFAFNQMSLLLGIVNLLSTIGVQYALRSTMSIPVSCIPTVSDKKNTSSCF